VLAGLDFLVFHIALDPWDLLIAEMVSVGPSDLAASQDGDDVIDSAADHETAADDGVEADDRDRVELLAQHVKVSAVVTVKLTKMALCEVTFMGCVIVIMMQVVVLLSLMVMVVVLMVVMVVVMMPFLMVVHVFVITMPVVAVVVVSVVVALVVVVELSVAVPVTVSTTMRRREHVAHVTALLVSVAVAVDGEVVHVTLGMVEAVQVEIYRHRRLAHKPLPHIDCAADLLSAAHHVTNTVHILDWDSVCARDGVPVVHVHRALAARQYMNMRVRAVIVVMVSSVLLPMILVALVTLVVFFVTLLVLLVALVVVVVVTGLLVVVVVVMAVVVVAVVTTGRSMSVHDDVHVTVFEAPDVLP